MNITKEFAVAATPAEVWAYLLDIPSVVPCLPGAELTGSDGNSHTGKVTAKLGPMTATFIGEATVVTDDQERTGRIVGKGVDRQGGSQGRVTLDYRVSEAEEGSSVALDANVTLSGAAAQFGRPGLIDEMAGRLISEFVTCLEARLQSSDQKAASAIQAGEMRGFGLLVGSIWSAFVNFLRRLFSSSGSGGDGPKAG